ncbi:MAG: hypothetical protein GY801_50610 [bacterium]|nr:hypothetical protein [bacterium]
MACPNGAFHHKSGLNLERLHSLKKGLMQDLLSGKVRTAGVECQQE